MLYKLDHCVESNIHRVLEHDRHESIVSINLHQREEVRAWIGSTQSELLWIDGFAETGKSDWTTKFCLEVEDAAKPVETITVLSYNCSEQANSSLSSRPHTILHSFIFQLIGRHRRMFTWEACRNFGLTRFRFQGAIESSTKLWALFHDCLRIAKPPCLYVTLDNIDALWSKTCKGSEGIEIFEGILQGLNGLAREQNRLDKILITSRLPDALECFSAMETMQSLKKTIVRLPRTAQKGVTVFGPPKEIHRLPIRRSTVPEAPPDLETLLANVDKSDEEDMLDSEPEDAPAESPEYRDSDDDDEYEIEALQSSKDYARYLNTPSDSDSDIGENRSTLHVDKSKTSIRKTTATEGSQTNDEADGHYPRPSALSQESEFVLPKTDNTDEDSDADLDLDENFLNQLTKGRKAKTPVASVLENEDSDDADDDDSHDVLLLLHEPLRKGKAKESDEDGRNELPLAVEDLAVKVRRQNDGEAKDDDTDSDACDSF